MMRLIATLLIAAGAAATPAHAQPPSVWGEPTEALAVQAMRNFARCIVERTPGGAESVLRMNFQTEDYHAALRRIARGHDDCAPNSTLRFSNVLLAGGLAESLLSARGRLQDLASRVALDPSRPPLEARDEIEVTGLCTVRAAPAQVAALLATQPGERPEREAVAAINPAFTGCVARGQTVRINRSGLRALLALSAYRLVQHNEAAGGQPGAAE